MVAIRNCNQKRVKMDWMFYTKIIAGVATVVIVGMLIKELVNSIKRSNNGEVSKKWDID
jgi:hypothetical protein